MAGKPKFVKWLLALLVECTVQACVSCEPGSVWETLSVALGEHLELNCTYDCSSGFVWGHWTRQGEALGCTGCWTEREVKRSGDLCTNSLFTPQVTWNHTHLNYTCLSCQHDQAGIPCKTERRVLLKISTSVQATSPPHISTEALTPTDGAADEGEDSSSEFTVVKVLAAVALVIVVLLTSYLSFLSYRRKRDASSDKIAASRHDRPGSDLDYASITFTNTDCQSDQDVPYADIMISVRGVSTPELRGQPGGAPGNPRARWREDSGPGPLQHVSRSADRLHVQPREVSRKLSSTSEYAVITYSTDALH